MKKGIIVIGMLLLSICLFGCGKKETTKDQVVPNDTQNELIEVPIEAEENQQITKGTVKVGYLGNPTEELLTEAKKIMLEDGWGLELVSYQDSLAMDQALIDKEIDGHLFAHAPYIESYNLVNQTQLMSAGVLWYEVYGIYGGLKQDLTSIKKGASVAIPDSGVNQARALLFLQELGYITVKEGLGPSTNLDDIVDNPNALVFHGIAEDKFLEARSSYDYLVCGGNTAVLCGYDTVKEPLVIESAKMESVKLLGTHLVILPEGEKNKGLQALKNAFESDTMQVYLKYMMQNTIATR